MKDYIYSLKVKSTQTYFSIILTIFFLNTVLLIADNLIGLPALESKVIGPLLILGTILSAMPKKIHEQLWYRGWVVLIGYSIIEFHFIFNVSVFYIIIYWFPLIPMMALVVQGLRSAMIWTLVVLLTNALNAVLVINTFGMDYVISVQPISFLTTSLIFTLTILVVCFLLYSLLDKAFKERIEQTNHLNSLKNELEQRNQAMKLNQNVIIELSRNENLFKLELQPFYNFIISKVHGHLNSSGASIWMFNEHMNGYHRVQSCSSLNEANPIDKFEGAQALLFMEAIRANSYFEICAKNTDFEHRYFIDNYLESSGYKSAIICPITINNVTKGFVCCEFDSEEPDNVHENVLFIQSITDLITLANQNQRINGLLSTLREKNSKVSSQRDEIETMNDELNALNEELRSINEHLEYQVMQRTKKLEQQNDKLSEYAFINSHLLRAPLSRILGLTHILLKENKENNNPVTKYLKESTEELDQIVRTISDKLYEGDNLTRRDINNISL